MRRDRIIGISEKEAKAVVNGIIIKDTDLLCSKRAGLIYLPTSDRKDFDKVFEIGEVVSTGCEVPDDEIAVGDVVIYRRLTAFWLPNGLDQPFLWKIEYPYSVLVVVPRAECKMIESTEPESQVHDLAWMQAREGNPIEMGIRHYM